MRDEFLVNGIVRHVKLAVDDSAPLLLVTRSMARPSVMGRDSGRALLCMILLSSTSDLLPTAIVETLLNLKFSELVPGPASQTRSEFFF